MSVANIEKLMTTDHFQYVIIQASDCYFSFDLLDEIECACIFALSSRPVHGWLRHHTYLEKWHGVLIVVRCIKFGTCNLLQKLFHEESIAWLEHGRRDLQQLLSVSHFCGWIFFYIQKLSKFIHCFYRTNVIMYQLKHQE